MTREQLIKKAKEIEMKYYQEVKDSRELGIGDEEIKTLEWSIAIDAMAELLGLSETEYFEIFLDTPISE